MKKLLSVVLIVMTIFMVSCSGTEVDAKDKQSMKFLISSKGENYDISYSAEGFVAPVLSQVFECLVRLDKQNNIVPGVAKSWEISGDGLTYTFYLREDAKWSDGKKVTADDFAYSWKRVVDKESKSDNLYLFTPYIKNSEQYHAGEIGEEDLGIRVVDEMTLELTLESPAPFMLQILSYRGYAPLREDVVANNPDWYKSADTFITNGPFKVESIIEDDFTLLRNEHYWNADTVYLDELIFDYIENNTDAINMYLNGEGDALYDVDLKGFPELTERGDLHYDPALSVSFYLINIYKEPYDDINVRKALIESLDRNKLVSEVTKGGETPLLGLIPSGLYLGGSDFRTSGGNYGLSPNAKVEESRSNLDASEYELGDYTVEVSYYKADITKQLSDFMADTWSEDLDLKTKVVGYEWPEHFEKILSGDYEIAAFGITGDFGHPIAFLNYFSEESNVNFTQWNNPEYEQVMDNYYNSSSLEEELEYLHEAEELLIESGIIIPLYQRKFVHLVNEELSGWYRTILGNYYFGEASFE